MVRMLNWNVLHELDDENGNATAWLTEVNGKIVWITKYPNTYKVESEKCGVLATLVETKSLVSAKRWVARYFS